MHSLCLVQASSASPLQRNGRWPDDPAATLSPELACSHAIQAVLKEGAVITNSKRVLANKKCKRTTHAVLGRHYLRALADHRQSASGTPLQGKEALRFLTDESDMVGESHLVPVATEDTVAHRMGVADQRILFRRRNGREMGKAQEMGSSDQPMD